MVRGMFEESRVLSELADNRPDFFIFLSRLLDVEKEGLLTFTPVGERSILRSTVIFLEMLTPMELTNLSSERPDLISHFPPSRYGGFDEYPTLLEVLGIEAPVLEQPANNSFEIDIVFSPDSETSNDGDESAVTGECEPAEELNVDDFSDQAPAPQEVALQPIGEYLVTNLPTIEASNEDPSQAERQILVMKNVSSKPPDQEFALTVVPTLESCLEAGKRFLSEGWPGLARDRFEEALKIGPRSVLANAYLSWMDFQKYPKSQEIRYCLESALDKALRIYDTDGDMLTFRGMLFKLDGKLSDAEALFKKAILINPAHPQALYQLRILTHRKTAQEEWPAIDFRGVRMDSPIIIQKRILGKTKVHCFREKEIRIGSGEHDNLVIGNDILPHLAKRHCVAFVQNGQHFVRRAASLGRVWVNGIEIEVRKDVRVLPEDCVRLGQLQGPALEFRMFDMRSLAAPSFDSLAD